jgi:hypothetical protein
LIERSEPVWFDEAEIKRSSRGCRPGEELRPWWR